MAHFTQALKTVLTRSFEGKQSALSDAAEMHHTDISRLLKETSPVSPEKLGKILLACSQEKDRAVLLHAAVRDFVGEEAYASHFTRPSDVDTLREDLGGPVFTATLPIHPYVERVLRYIIHRVQHDGSVAEALRLIGHFLELPEDSTGVENWVASPAVVDPDAQARWNAMTLEEQQAHHAANMDAATRYFEENAIVEGPPRRGSNSPKDVIGGSSPPTC